LLTYTRPTERFIFVQREEVAAQCPQCKSKNIKKYPVFSSSGWYQVVKCQDCLYSLERKKGPLCGEIGLISDFM
jgi:transposase-like protein